MLYVPHGDRWLMNMYYNWLGVMSPLTPALRREGQANLCECDASMAYIITSEIARAT